MELEQSIQMQEASRATESGLVRNTLERREEKREGESAPCEPTVERKRKQDRPHEEGLIKTPSPEYADAVQVVATMGGREEKGESRKVGTRMCSGTQKTPGDVHCIKLSDSSSGGRCSGGCISSPASSVGLRTLLLHSVAD